MSVFLAFFFWLLAATLTLCAPCRSLDDDEQAMAALLQILPSCVSLTVLEFQWVSVVATFFFFFFWLLVSSPSFSPRVMKVWRGFVVKGWILGVRATSPMKLPLFVFWRDEAFYGRRHFQTAWS